MYTRCLIWGMVSSGCDAGSHPCTPFLDECTCSCAMVTDCGCLWSIMNMSTQHVLGMFHMRYLLAKEVSGYPEIQKGLCYCGKQPQGGEMYRLERLISVPLSSHISTNNNQIRHGADLEGCSNSSEIHTCVQHANSPPLVCFSPSQHGGGTDVAPTLFFFFF